MKTTHADPMKTKTGKPRLGPLSLKQLHDMLAKSSRPKDKSKIRNKIRSLEEKGFKLSPEPVADTVTETV
jgi:hypothetical protein